ncbi:hypothetical protein KDA_13960 [Dictyobacter alpinus]|uniref:Uncharacterized protein n=1 Tax=Dictyobacter alpinus TaxID=2014873 RepID=A0A402B3I8_9CHLR|nr:hypothetical protein [Dictyobacter alpinus]GCE25912.1 hypothetical protein KDA_13960 [Dictyobacter alpinus]
MLANSGTSPRVTAGLAPAPVTRTTRHKLEAGQASPCSSQDDYVFEGRFLRELGQGQALPLRGESGSIDFWSQE